MKKTLFTWALALAAVSSALSAKAEIDIAQTPVFVSESVPPLSMLVMGRDHSLFFEAYNDASDIDGDGELDLRFKPSIEYYGIFDSNLCYTHSGGETNTNLFSPSGRTSALTTPTRACPGQWSGNWLNYVTTSRIDALRKVLYGGHRDVDTDTQTILRRAYIPQDGHSWAKEYTSPDIDKYDISKYTPFGLPSAGKRHFFGNLTKGSTNCNTLDSCSNKPPLLSVITNSTVRVWDWASSERPVLSDNTHQGTRKNYTVRVKVCNETFIENCKKYPDGNYKPIGLLHEYGENSSMLFGLLTGSYNKNMSGGVLRKVISLFKNEVAIGNGTFTASATIVNTIDELRIRDFNNNKTDNSYRTGSIRTRSMNEGEFVDWGNPIGEMMYETLRYFAGKGSPTGAFDTSGGHDAAVGLSAATWDNPYTSDSEAKAQRCAKPNMIVMSSVNVSYDSDQLPGISSTFGSFSGDLSGLNVSEQAKAITQLEPDVKGLKFIGEAGNTKDFAPTAKTVTSLSDIRGLAPEEPTKQGSYYSASVARYGSMTDLNATTGDQKADTYIVALASSFPRFEFPIGSGATQKTISMVPFAKTIDGANVDRAKGKYQPTDPIVDLYIEEYSSTRAKFRINFEADEQGNDFDMDVIAEYTVEVMGTQLKVTVKPIYEGTGSNQNLGYVISGTDRDGTYLVAQDKAQDLKYFLNVPPGQNAGYCNYVSEATMDNSCKRLPWINGTSTLNGASASQSEQLFMPSSSTAATSLKNPLWYAAKYGRTTTKWDTDGNGIPDNYFLVTNALTLKDQLDKAFNALVQNNNSVAAPASGREPARGSSTDENLAIYRSTFDLQDWSGELIKEAINTAGGKQEVWRASEQIPDSRTIKMADVSGALISFTWSNLNGRTFDGKNLQAVLNTAPGTNGATDNYGQARVQFVRGEACTAAGCDSFRSRTSTLGDFIGSSPVVVAGAQYLSYIADTLNGTAGDYRAFKEAQEAQEAQGDKPARPGRQAMVYIGANDGMLHAFNATTGAEAFAFVPTAVIGNLNKLSQRDYTSQTNNKHQYYVDGAITVSDVYYSGAWHTVLVGALGAGGREIYALDITDPAAITLLWEFTTDSIGSKICTESVCQSSDLGYSIPAPTIARLHNGKWNVVIPNGYNSPNGDSGKAVLFILDIETGALVKRLGANGTANTSNGLSTVKLADNNSDGIADYAYAGDIQGHLWRFDLIGSANRNDTPAGGVVAAFNISQSPTTVAAEFQVSFGGTPLYTAKTVGGTAQSITSAPSLIRHPSRVGYIVAFGTGRYLGLSDKVSPFRMDTLYGIWDKQTRGQLAGFTNPVEPLDRSALQQQTLTQKIETFTATSIAADGTPKATTTTRTVRLLTQTNVRWRTDSGLTTDGDKYGWYLDLATTATSAGERIVDDMIKAGSVLLVSSRTPNSDPCESGIDGFYYGLDPATGGRTAFNVFDMNSDGEINSKDQSGSNVVTGYQAPAGGITLTDGENPGDLPCLRGPDGECMSTDLGPSTTGRQSWRITPSTP
ncbi:MAG: pilus assembly protein [Pseudomonas sp.]